RHVGVVIGGGIGRFAARGGRPDVDRAGRARGGFHGRRGAAAVDDDFGRWVGTEVEGRFSPVGAGDGHHVAAGERPFVGVDVGDRRRRHVGVVIGGGIGRFAARGGRPDVDRAGRARGGFHGRRGAAAVDDDFGRWVGTEVEGRFSQVGAGDGHHVAAAERPFVGVDVGDRRRRHVGVVIGGGIGRFAARGGRPDVDRAGRARGGFHGRRGAAAVDDDFGRWVGTEVEGRFSPVGAGDGHHVAAGERPFVGVDVGDRRRRHVGVVIGGGIGRFAARGGRPDVDRAGRARGGFHGRRGAAAVDDDFGRWVGTEVEGRFSQVGAGDGHHVAAAERPFVGVDVGDRRRRHVGVVIGVGIGRFAARGGRPAVDRAGRARGGFHG